MGERQSFYYMVKKEEGDPETFVEVRLFVPEGGSYEKTHHSHWAKDEAIKILNREFKMGFRISHVTPITKEIYDNEDRTGTLLFEAEWSFPMSGEVKESLYLGKVVEVDSPDGNTTVFGELVQIKEVTFTEEFVMVKADLKTIHERLYAKTTNVKETGNESE